MGLDGGNGDEFPGEQFNFIFSYSNLWLSVYFPWPLVSLSRFPLRCLVMIILGR